MEFWHEHSGSVLEAGQSAVVTIDRNQFLDCMLSHVPALYSALPQQRLLAHHHRHCHHCHHCHGYHEECSVPSMAFRLGEESDTISCGLASDGFGCC